MAKTPKPKTGKIGKLKAFVMKCPTVSCTMEYWRTKDQLNKVETCGGCREKVILIHVME